MVASSPSSGIASWAPSSSTSTIVLSRNSSARPARPPSRPTWSSSSGRRPKMRLRISRMVRFSRSIAPLDPGPRLIGVVVHELRDVLEREAYPVDALDDPVVEILADPLALLDDRQALDLLVEPGVLDGDPGVEGEHLDERLVGLAELPRPALVRQVEVADGLALDRDRHAQERGHPGMVGREPVAPGMTGDVGDPERTPAADDQAQETVALRQGPDPLAVGPADPARDEPLEDAVGVGDPQGGVFRSDQVPRPVADQLEDPIDREDPGDPPGGRIERLELGGAPSGALARPGGVEAQLHRPERFADAVIGQRVDRRIRPLGRHRARPARPAVDPGRPPGPPR